MDKGYRECVRRPINADRFKEMIAMPPLETRRLAVRPFTTADLPDFAALNHAAFAGAPADPESYRDLIAYFALADRAQARLRHPPYGDRAIVLRETGALIGSVGVVPCLAPFGQLGSQGGKKDAPFTPEIGLFWMIAPQHQRQGYATEAAGVVADYLLRELRVGRIVATTESDNAASIGVMRRLGMTVEQNPFPTPPWFQVVGTLVRA
jgi:RimJ/RimL family protein N-acetyltransferase